MDMDPYFFEVHKDFICNVPVPVDVVFWACEKV